MIMVLEKIWTICLWEKDLPGYGGAVKCTLPQVHDEALSWELGDVTSMELELVQMRWRSELTRKHSGARWALNPMT